MFIDPTGMMLALILGIVLERRFEVTILLERAIIKFLQERKSKK